MPMARRFFPQQVVTPTSRTTVNVGGNGDCGFRSIAAGLVDNFFTHPHLNKTLLNHILQRHFIYYPVHRPNLSEEETPHQLMSRLLKKVTMSELIQTMAYTLRQLAVDEMVKNPVQYPGAFVQNHEHTSPAEMRQPQTWIDESSISALANALNLPIRVRLISSGKELSSPPLTYHSQSRHATMNPPVVISLERGHYQPSLLNPRIFQSNVYDSKVQMSPVQTVVTDSDMPEILKKIAEAEARTVAAFESTRDCLTAMVTAGELTKSRLLEVYIKGIVSSDYLQGRMKQVDKEHQADFFSRAIADHPSHTITSKHDDAIVAELVHAIARAISIGHMCAEEVFTQIDAQQSGLLVSS